MKSKVHPFINLLNALSLCALLFCILGLLFPMQPVSVAAKPSTEVSREQPLFSFPSQQLDTIRIIQGQNSFCLVNHGSSFVMEGMETVPLSSEKINTLLNLLEAFPAASQTATDSTPFRRIDLSFTNAKDQTLFLYKEENKILLNWQNCVYRFSPEMIEALLWSAEDFVDLTILPKLQFGEGKLSLSGVLHEETLELSFYTEENHSLHAEMTFPQSAEIDGETMQSWIHSLSDLCANEIVVVDPKIQDLDFFGLSVPFCTVDGQISGETFQLSTSLVQPDGSVYLISNQQPLIYAIDINQLPLLSVCLETLLEESLFTPDYQDTTALSVSFSQNQYRFTKWNGQVLCRGQPINEQDFYDFFRLSTALIPQKTALLLPENMESILTLTFSYTNPEKSKDFICFYPYNDKSVLVSVNGSTDYLIDVQLVEEICISCMELLK